VAESPKCSRLTFSESTLRASDHDSLSRFLNRLLRHSRLSEEEQQAILSVRGEASQVKAHHDIVSPGRTVDHACLVVRGLAARCDQMRDGQRQITNFHIPGDMCDLHSVAVPKPSWSVTACSPTTVLHVPHSDLLALVDRYPAVAIAFWRDTVVDGSVLAKWVGNLGRKDAQARLSHLLCEMGLRTEMAKLGARTSYQFEVTKEQLADAVGITAVHLNRTLQALRAQGLITFGGRNVTIHDWDALVEIAEFDPVYLLSAEEGRGPAGGRPSGRGAGDALQESSA
jgi:CRP-like cAMP-binding protein